MTRSISKIIFFLTLAFNSTLFGQGRVDSDSILHNIWWTTYRIDADTNLICTVNSSNPDGLTKLRAFYSKENNTYKMIELSTIPSGTQMTSCYFKDDKPIFISVAKNNYRLSGDKRQFLNAVNSFSDIVDTNYIRQSQLYNNLYKANYFFFQDTVRYVNVMTGNIIRVDNKKDKEDGLKLYDQSKRLLMTKP